MKRPYEIRHKSTIYLGVFISVVLVLLLVLPKSPSQLHWPTEYLIFVAWMIIGFVAYRQRQRKKDLSEKERAYQILGTTD